MTFSALTVSDASKLMFLGGTSEVTATTGGTAGTWDSTNKTLTWTPGSTDNFTFFAFYQDGKAATGTNNLASSDAIVVTYELDASKTNTSISIGATTDFEVLQTEAFSAPKATLTAGEATLTGKTITYASSNEGVATVASDGTVTIVGMGKTTITATFAGDDSYNGSNASYDLTVVGVFTTLADARTAQGTSTAENSIQMTFTNVRVTSVSGSSVTITDDVTTAIIYQSGHGFEVGNILNGTVRCTMTYYNSGSLFEFKGITKTSEGLSVTSIAAISVNTTSAVFSYEVENGPSIVTTANVSGNNLTEDITATVTTGNDYFELSVDETNFGTSVTASKDASTTLYVRMKAGLAKGNYSGSITLTSTDAEDVTIALTGSVLGASFTWDLSIASYEATPSEDLVTWISSFATMSNAIGKSSTGVNNYLGGDANSRTSSRFYSNNVLTIAPKTGYALESIEFVATSTSYASVLSNSTWTNATTEASGTTVTVTPTDGKALVSATIGGTCGFTEVTVYYEKITSLPVTISAAGWATLCLPFDAEIPDGVEVYAITGVGADGESLEMENLNEALDAAIPANEGVLLKGTVGTETNVTFTAAELGKYYFPADNLLVGTTKAGGETFDDGGLGGTSFYILANDPTDGIGFYYQVDGGSSATCAQYKAVLRLATKGAPAIGFRLDGATKIDAVPAATEDAAIYDLTGRRVENATRGIYIAGGKKVVVK